MHLVVKDNPNLKDCLEDILSGQYNQFVEPEFKSHQRWTGPVKFLILYSFLWMNEYQVCVAWLAVLYFVARLRHCPLDYGVPWNGQCHSGATKYNELQAKLRISFISLIDKLSTIYFCANFGNCDHFMVGEGGSRPLWCGAGNIALWQCHQRLLHNNDRHCRRY